MSDKTTSVKTRTPSEPDIQALAKIDRILSQLKPEVVSRTIVFLVSKYGSISTDFIAVRETTGPNTVTASH